MDLASALKLLGGLAMFIFGMKMMSDGLEHAAGDRLRRILEVLTGNRFAAVGVGAGMTALVQSSSATTVMVVGFVNAGLMTLLQATGVIIGANIGSCITAQLIAFQLSDIAPLILFIGMILTIFVKKRMASRIGEIVLGFGLLFVGMAIMSETMVPLKNDAAFQSLLLNFNNPIFGILIGALFTAIIQSSAASIGILQAFGGLGLINLNAAAYVVLGTNIGTCITAILAAIGTSQNSKRAAGIHLMFNIIGTLVFMLALILIPGIIEFVKSFSVTDTNRQIANFHLLFNVSVAVLLFPFASLMVKLVKRILPDKRTDGEIEKRLVYLDARIAQTPPIILSQSIKELVRMGKITVDNLVRATEAFFDRSEQKARKVLEVETTIDYLTHHITEYLIEFRGADISEHDLKVLGSLHHVVIDMERIGDLAENISEFAMSLIEKKSKFSDEAYAELRTMTDKTLETLQKSLDTFTERDIYLLNEVDRLEQEVDDMKTQYLDNHISRLQGKFCDPQTGVIFTNMVSTLERVADHATNIAYSITNK